VRKCFRFLGVLAESRGLIKVAIFLPLALIWFVSRLAETNRTPYDFSEGESELVSGFNTEYRGGRFVLIFMAEYRRILFMRLLFRVFFFSRGGRIRIIFKGVVVSCWFIWVRGSLPRYRYDKLINLA
jgi:NADH-ubiquinone oxidoreductase chain 1